MLFACGYGWEQQARCVKQTITQLSEKESYRITIDEKGVLIEGADDKGIYYYVPAMIKYYLGEEPILSNAPTYLPFYEEDMKYVLDNIQKLVIKDVAESGGYGVVFGSELSLERVYELKKMIQKEPRRFIAQEVIQFNDLKVVENGAWTERKADLRAFVLTGEEPVVWKSGLTRFSKDANSFVVNSSQGGGFKDTWVLSR